MRPTPGYGFERTVGLCCAFVELCCCRKLHVHCLTLYYAWLAADVKEGITPHFVNNYSEVFEVALQYGDFKDAPLVFKDAAAAA